ncbi:MAG TPA: response regulator [Candidatus Dormibacteraeota bacterium]|jgi:CheY-like chemotaxis protein|nr:response regulator [Candidatus Dormibacteraeota bacterium]
MRTVLDDVLTTLGNNRDYVILGLAVLVLVEGAIIVLWARRAIHLQRDVRQASAAASEAARRAAEAAAAVDRASGSLRAVERTGGVTIRDGERKVYSVAGRTTPVVDLPYSVPATPPAPPRPTVAPSSAPPAPLMAQWTPAASPAPALEPAASIVPLRPEPPAGVPEVAEPPADYVNPVAEQAAAWVLPEIAASQPAVPEPTPSNGNGWHPAEPAAAPSNGNGPHPSESTPTTLGWSGSTVPVEPAADFAVITDPGAVRTPPAPPSPAPAAHPNLTVLNGATPWVLPSAGPVPDAPATATAWPTASTARPFGSTAARIDTAGFDGDDDVLLDDPPTTGDILLVEDDPTIAKLYRVLLESRGYSVRYAADGIEGLDRTHEKRPDLVLLDIMMPRMNGIAFLQALRAGEMRDVPVVVLSNFMEKQLVDDAMSLGAVEYMVKAQTRPEALVGALPHWLRGERAFSF